MKASVVIKTAEAFSFRSVVLRSKVFNRPNIRLAFSSLLPQQQIISNLPKTALLALLPLAR